MKIVKGSWYPITADFFGNHLMENSAADSRIGSSSARNLYLDMTEDALLHNSLSY